MTTSIRDRAGTTVLTFPQDDAVLAERVREIVAEEEPRTADETRATLETHLRAVHPRVTIRQRSDLAGFGQAALYVFRDGSAVSELDDTWVDEPTSARVVTDESGTYVDANDAAAELFGLPREAIIGRRPGDFTRPDARIHDADELWRRLAETGRLHSLAVVSGSSANDGTLVEFVTIRDGDGDGPGRTVTVLRPLPQE
jgi:PAS domain S-box-containing protein